MEMNVRDDKQLVEIWLTNAEKKDLALREGLKDIYDKYKKKKYLVAVFESGEKDLYQGTLDLLAYNKRKRQDRRHDEPFHLDQADNPVRLIIQKGVWSI